MSTTTDTTPSQPGQQELQELLDEAALDRIVRRLGTMLDEHRFELWPTLFTADATVATPGGRSQGEEAIVAQARRNHRPGIVTQHRISDVVVDLDGDRAAVRANYVGTFVKSDGPVGPGEPTLTQAPVFEIGSVYRFEGVRTAEGWRLRSMEMHPIWEVGERP
jgi:hypothetical protein